VKFHFMDRVEIRPVSEWICHAPGTPASIEGATGTVLGIKTSGVNRVPVQFDEEVYERLNLKDAIPSYLWVKTVPRTAALRPRQIKKVGPMRVTT